MYTVTKEIKFDAAHRLMNYQGLCNNIHGHTYKVLVALESESALLNGAGVNTGMVLDFGELKKVISNVINEYDHALILNDNDRELIKLLKPMEKLKIVKFPGEPTAENMASFFFHAIIGELSKLEKDKKETKFVLKKVTVYETETSFAEFSQ